LAQSNDLKAEAVAGTEESAEASEKAAEPWSHEFGFISYRGIPMPSFTVSICCLTEFWRHPMGFDAVENIMLDRIMRNGIMTI
jgi:hypothetical protein